MALRRSLLRIDTASLLETLGSLKMMNFGYTPSCFHVVVFTKLFFTKLFSPSCFDVFISGINNQNLTLQTYHKSTYTGLLLNFKSFTSFSYKISLIKCLIDGSFKISNNFSKH